MATFFYTDANGQKQGPVNDQQLRELVAQGTITPKTPMETESGHKGLAGQIRGLFKNSPPNSFTASTPATNQTMPQSVPVPIDKKGWTSCWINVISIFLIVCTAGIGGWIIYDSETKKSQEKMTREKDRLIAKAPADEPLAEQSNEPFVEPKLPIEVPSVNVLPSKQTAAEAMRNSSRRGRGNTAETKPQYVAGCDFSDGVTWVQTRYKEWHCVDKTGKIILKLGDDEKPCSCFSHGVALVKRSDKIVELIDKNGKVISSPKSGEYDRIKGFIRDIGMILVYKHIDTFQLTEDRAGIIDSKGNWKVPLCNDVMFTSAAPNKDDTPLLHIEPGRFYRNFVGYDSLAVAEYWGDGLFTAKEFNENSPNFFNNILTGKTFTAKLFKHIRPDGPDSPGYRIGCYPPHMEGGYGVYYEQLGGGYVSIYKRYAAAECTVYSINSSGEVRQLINQRYDTKSFMPRVAIGNFKEGLFFYSDKEAGGNIQGFFDIQGKLVLDLFEHDIGFMNRTSMPEFDGGYCFLPLKNPQDVDYYTVIDKSGKFPCDLFQFTHGNDQPFL